MLQEWIKNWHVGDVQSPTCIQRAVVMLVAAHGDLFIGASGDSTTSSGSQYYMEAVGELSKEEEGMTLEHAQAQALAALYLIQQGRVRESWCRIRSACGITLILAHL